MKEERGREGDLEMWKEGKEEIGRERMKWKKRKREIKESRRIEGSGGVERELER